MKPLLGALALIAILASSFTVSPTASAATDPSPEVFQNFAGCYRSLVQSDDLFCINRYQLPTYETAAPMSAEAWCQYLVDQDGCTADPVDPTAPGTLQSGAAYVTLYDGASTLLGQVLVPRVGYSVAGLYFPAGHGITWGDTSLQACVESSATLFTTFEQSCLTPVWNTAANTEAAQRTQLGSDLVAQFVNLETEDPLIPVNGYVINNRINAAGRDIALEALNVIDRILTNTFQSSSSPAITDSFATPSSELQLQTDINATATAFVGALDGAGSDLGVSGEALGIGFFAVLGMIAFWIVKRFTDGNNTPLALIAMLTVFLTGVTAGAVPVTVAAVALVLIAAVGVLFMLRKMVGLT